MVHFIEVSVPGTKTTGCAKCGKRIKRQKKFWQTISPFNKRPDGLPKAAADIVTELTQERDAWMTQPEVCSKCQ